MRINWKSIITISSAIALAIGAAAAWAAQTNYLGTVFIADPTTPTRQLAVNANGSINAAVTGGTIGITQLTGDVTAGPGSNSQAATIKASVSLTGAPNIGAGPAILSSPSAAALQFGAADAAVAIAQTARVQSVVAGTAAANGANWTIIGSLPTGTGTSGDIIFQTGVKTGSGTTQGTPTTALTIAGETQLVSAAVGFAQGANVGIASCTAATLGATITIKGGLITAMTGC